MKLWNKQYKNSLYDISEEENDAKYICDKLGIIHYTINGITEFKKYVIDDFICSYSKCLTPNPCIECNKYLKFGTMYKLAKELGVDYIATGHYAKIKYSEKYKEMVLVKSYLGKKDQSYVLYNIDKEVLNHILFPLSDFKNKEEVRRIARENDLKVADKSDSEDICFIPDGNYKKFLKENSNIKEEQGNIILKTGQVLGKHAGLTNYTIGQRRGLGISYKEPLYVINMNKDKNELIVGIEKELYGNTLYANNINYLLDFDKWENEVFAKIRYSAKEAKAKVTKKDNMLEVIFEEKQRAITKGQSVVFYDKDNIVLRRWQNSIKK